MGIWVPTGWQIRVLATRFHDTLRVKFTWSCSMVFAKKVIRLNSFISYSRVDSNFVDKLEADLRVRGIQTWVDRSKLEGGQDWAHEIENAITRHDIFILVMSPDAMSSDYVRMEYQIAFRLKKRFLPIAYRECQMTPEVAAQTKQFFDFFGNPYAAALPKLIYACYYPDYNFSSSTANMQLQAIQLEATDPERAAVIYQFIVEREHGAGDGKAQRDLERLNQRLYPQRARYLRERSVIAHTEGAYGVEAGALEALVALGGQDPAMFGWAREYLPVAEQNRAMWERYNIVVLGCVESNPDRAREELREVWHAAPYYRDPSGVSPMLGIASEMPTTYEEAKEQRQVKEEAELRKTQAIDKRNRTERIVSQLITQWKSSGIEESVRSNLGALSYESGTDAGTPYSRANELMRHFVQTGKSVVEVKSEVVNISTSESSVERILHSELVDKIAIICAIAIGFIVLLIVGIGSSNLLAGLTVGLIAGWVGGYVIGMPVSLLLEGLESGGRSLRIRDANKLERAAIGRIPDLESTASQWRNASQKELEEKILRISIERDNAIAAIRERYKQQGL
jgi:hypothetical protein